MAPVTNMRYDNNNWYSTWNFDFLRLPRVRLASPPYPVFDDRWLFFKCETLVFSNMSFEQTHICWMQENLWAEIKMCKNVCLLHLVLCLDWVGGIIASLSRLTEICNGFTFAVWMKSFWRKKETSKLFHQYTWLTCMTIVSVYLFWNFNPLAYDLFAKYWLSNNQIRLLLQDKLILSCCFESPTNFII